MLFSKKAHDECFLICDIGSGSVALALVSESQKREVLLLKRSRIGVHENPKRRKDDTDSISALKQMSKEFSAQLHELQKTRPFYMKRAHIVFSSPWYISKTIAKEIKKDRPFVLDSHVLSEIIDQEEKHFEQLVASDHSDRYSGKGIHMIEREVMRVALNGYSTTDPYLKKASRINFSLYMGIIAYDFLLTVDTILRNTFHLSKVTAHTFPLLAYKAISEIYPHEKHFVIIDFGAEATDVSFVEEGVIISSESFSFGRSHIIQNISKDLAVPIDVAESYIKMMKEGVLETETAQDVTHSISKSLVFWIERWNDMCLRNNCADIQSKKIHITIKNDVSSFVTEVIQKELHCEVFVLSSDSTGLKVSFKGVPYDASVAVSAIAL